MVLHKIGRILASSHVENIEHPAHIQQGVNNLIDLIRQRFVHIDVSELIEGVRPLYLELRYDLIRHYLLNEEVVKKVNRELDEEINRLVRADSPIEYTLASFVEVHSRIFGGVVRRFDLEKNILRGADVKNSAADYTFESYLLHPEPRVQYVKHWIDATINYEIGMIIANLYLLGGIGTVPQARVEALLSYIKQWLIRYGAYAIFIDYWRPDQDWIRENAMGNNMKLLAAKLEYDCYRKESGMIMSPQAVKTLLGVA